MFTGINMFRARINTESMLKTMNSIIIIITVGASRKSAKYLKLLTNQSEQSGKWLKYIFCRPKFVFYPTKWAPMPEKVKKYLLSCAFL